MIYKFKFDENGFITDLTRLAAPADYISHDIDPAAIPADVLCGYYKFTDGVFVVDTDAKAAFEAAQEAPENERF